MKLPLFKIRASAYGRIAGSVSLGSLTDAQKAELAELENPKKPELTVKQAERLAELEGRERSSAMQAEYDKLIAKRDAVPALSDKQAENLAKLIAKRDAPPELPQGAKTYCAEWVKQQLYGITRQFSSKYTDKGNLCESEAIAIYVRQHGLEPLVKNLEHFTDDHFTGTPDLLHDDIVADQKCPWDCFTFPLFDDKIPEFDYYHQLQIYMALTGKRNARLVYTLMDAPDEIIEQEARKEQYRRGEDEMTMDLEDEVRARMTYSHLPDTLRYRMWEFQYDAEKVDHMRQRVEMCRAYIQQTFGHWFDQPDAEPQVIAFNQYDYLYNDPVVLLDMVAKCETIEHLTMLWNANPHHHEAQKPVFTARRQAISHP